MADQSPAPQDAPLRPSRQVLLWVEFEGTDFCGFQRQAPPLRTVAGEIEKAWLRMMGEAIVARSSSRTDSGVHARRMPVLVMTAVKVPPRNLKLGLNRHLPPDLAVQAVEDMPPEFHVRHDAVGKRYVYRILRSESLSPMWRRTAWHVRAPLDVEAMMRAAPLLAGVHDYASFRDIACVAKSTVRNLRRIQVEHFDERLLTVTVEGNAFLMHMVRILAGTLVDVGHHRLAPEDMPAILARRDRTRAGQTAPAHGLTLDEVMFGPAGERQGLDYKRLLTNMNRAWGETADEDED